MAVSYLGATTATGTSTLAINKPASVANGDVMIACIAVDHYANTPTGPAGWAALGADHSTVDGASSQVFYKFANSEGASYTFTLTAGATGAGVIRAYRGIDSAILILASHANDTSGIASPITISAGTGVTPTRDGSLLIWFGVLDNINSGAATFTAPSGYANASSADNGSFDHVGSFDRTQATAAATGAVSGSATWTGGGTAGCIGYVVALTAQVPAVTILGTPDATHLIGEAYTPVSGAEAVVWETSQKAAATTLDVTDIVVTGSTSGTATYSLGQVAFVKARALLSPDVVAIVFWVLKTNLPVGDLTATITFAGTESASTLRAVKYSLDSETGLIALDTSGTAVFTATADPWAAGTLTCRANTVQLYAIGITSPSTGVVTTGTTGSPFNEQRDVNAGAHRMVGGDYSFSAGGSRDFNVDLNASDTGAIAVASFYAAAVSSVTSTRMLLGVG